TSHPHIKELKFQALPYYSILWGQGHFFRDWIDYRREQNEIENFGAYCLANYMETSVKLNKGVDDTFTVMAKMLMKGL
ncbi:MAG: hypothetical protein ACFFFK_11960, partial [Candidatus Thorarchaeota archaeon]